MDFHLEAGPGDAEEAADAGLEGGLEDLHEQGELGRGVGEPVGLQAGALPVHEDGLDVGERVEAEVALVAPEAALLDAAEGQRKETVVSETHVAGQGECVNICCVFPLHKPLLDFAFPPPSRNANI